MILGFFPQAPYWCLRINICWCWYLQDDHNGENYVPPGQQPQQQYYPRDYSSERREPPPAHLPPPLEQPPSYRQERRIKEEPGLDMSQWSHPTTYHQSPYYRKMAPPSPGNFPPAPPFSLDANEAMKVERKRARNRIAASKCRYAGAVWHSIVQIGNFASWRMRKIEKIQTLDQQTSTLKAENEELAGLAKKLKEQNYKLQQELRWHINNGKYFKMEK